MDTDPKIFRGTCDPDEWAALVDALSLVSDVSDLLALGGPLAKHPPLPKPSGKIRYRDKRIGRKRPDAPLPENRDRTPRQSWLFHTRRWERGY